jgi:hypothetical protein
LVIGYELSNNEVDCYKASYSKASRIKRALT